MYAHYSRSISSRAHLIVASGTTAIALLHTSDRLRQIVNTNLHRYRVSAASIDSHQHCFVETIPGGNWKAFYLVHCSYF